MKLGDINEADVLRKVKERLNRNETF